jgi:phosphoribosylformylglycinamidine cyclo-ligase
MSVKAMAHITGGGFIGNIPRVLPESCCVSIDRGSWEVPPIFQVIAKEANLDAEEMFRTFNMGIGLVMLVAAKEVDGAIGHLRDRGIETAVIGEVLPKGTAAGRAVLLS